MKSETRQHRTQRAPGRPREFDLEQALDRAVKIFSVQGYNGTSVSDLAHAMQVTAGSLYKAFPDKRAIFMGAFDRYVAVRQEKLGKRLASMLTGRDKIQAILSHYAEFSQGVEGRQGCLVVGSAVELAGVDPEIAARVAQTLGKYEQRFEYLIQEGRLDGSIPADVEPKSIAALLVCITQGMRVMGKIGRSAAKTRALAVSAMKLVT
jgi:TetR/AcrR family transcriptional repressor of nem operon